MKAPWISSILTRGFQNLSTSEKLLNNASKWSILTIPIINFDFLQSYNNKEIFHESTVMKHNICDNPI